MILETPKGYKIISEKPIWILIVEEDKSTYEPYYMFHENYELKVNKDKIKVYEFNTEQECKEFVNYKNLHYKT